jgi:hypothetical protein
MTRRNDLIWSLKSVLKDEPLKLLMVLACACISVACGGGGAGKNSVPVANAGANITAQTHVPVVVDASSSSDADGDPLTYKWSFGYRPVDSKPALSSLTSVKTTFTTDLPGTYNLNLVVNDGKVDSATATVTISVTVGSANGAPLANAGPKQTVVAGSLVTLDGAASADVNKDPLTYAWTLTGRPNGSGATLTSTTSVKPTFIADVAGIYVASLVVNDGKVNSVASTVTVEATTPAVTINVAPIANAGSSRTVAAGDAVSLDGSASADANGDLLTYSWTLASKPEGSTSFLSTSNTALVSLKTDLAGTYEVQLIVNDGKLDSLPKTTNVVAYAPIAPLPVGSGLYVSATQAASEIFYLINETIPSAEIKATACLRFIAADVDPISGVVFGLAADGRSVYAFDPIGGRCQLIFQTPQIMKGLAAFRVGAGSGAVSFQSSTLTMVGSDSKLHHYSLTGVELMSVPLSGLSNQTNIPNLQSLDGIGYGPDGMIYGVVAGTLWKLNPSGQGQFIVSGLPAGSTDIDVSQNGTLRLVSAGTVYRVDLLNLTSTGMTFPTAQLGTIFSR